ncbi:hypothetical protein G7Y89_g9558 [Cudoniella acicularis]|uniref:Tat pathway signal sequence n=1 Tax=Cudoniella acicularis TaxID=354080 RepID=A0A8H4RI49_9HELO|nr:hypothetical protein G7Y89_g9558 [Cudoniella acicularis]
MFFSSNYQPVAARDSESESESQEKLLYSNEYSQKKNKPTCSWFAYVSTLAIGALACFSAGLAVGYYTNEGASRKSKALDFMSLTDPKPHGPESDAAWDAMFPRGVGFVKHPSVSPELSGLAVFHELHCVNILRVGYYAALDGTLAEMQHQHDHNKRPDPHHLRHCFDYLRQALMCAADTNLEPVDFELGGVTGWKYNRKCRDFEAVKDWADQWRSWPDDLESAE